MGNLGLGVMIGMLSGNESSVLAFNQAINRKITAITVDDTYCNIEVDGIYKIRLYDNGQSCCEHRYMSVDGDDMSAFIGATLIGAEVRDGGSQPNDYESHDIEFLLINTSFGVITISNHNEHNGYYGGFNVVCEEVK